MSATEHRHPPATSHARNNASDHPIPDRGLHPGAGTVRSSRRYIPAPQAAPGRTAHLCHQPHWLLLPAVADAGVMSGLQQESRCQVNHTILHNVQSALLTDQDRFQPSVHQPADEHVQAMVPDHQARRRYRSMQAPAASVRTAAFYNHPVTNPLFTPCRVISLPGDLAEHRKLGLPQVNIR
ncbi:hypothetical protein ESCOCK445B1_25390 [Escherichia coli]